MAAYSELEHEEIEKAIHEYKYHGKYKSKRQAVAVGLSKARETGKQIS